MKPGDIVSFNVIRNGQVVFGVQGVLVTYSKPNSIVKTRHPVFYNEPADKKEYFYAVSSESLKLVELRLKDFLESGRVVIFKEGSRGIVVSLRGVNFILIKNKLIPLQEFDENLHYQFSEKYDIVKIAELKGGCALEHFDIVREEMLDIIWEESFCATDENKELHLLKTFVIKLEEKL